MTVRRAAVGTALIVTSVLISLLVVANPWWMVPAIAGFAVCLFCVWRDALAAPRRPSDT